MRPYENVRLIEGPDVADIHRQGRKSSVGTIRRGELTRTWTDNPKICHSDRGYCSSVGKKQIRRSLKRADRTLSMREELKLVAQEEVESDKEFSEFFEFDSDYYDDYGGWDDYDYDDSGEESKEELSLFTADELSWFENEEF